MATKYRWQQEVCHAGLNKYRIVKAASRYELTQKVNALKAQWDEQWERKLEQKERQLEKEARKVEREAKIQNDMQSTMYAGEQSRQAEELQISLDRLLLSHLSPRPLNPDDFKDFSIFEEEAPLKPERMEIPVEPLSTDDIYNPTPSFFTKLFPSKMEEFSQRNHERFEQDHEAWEKKKKDAQACNEEAQKKYEDALSGWKERKAAFQKEQREKNEEANLFFHQVKEGNPEAIERYFITVLEKISFPFDYTIAAEAEYLADGKTLILDIYLPTLEDIPNLKSVSYVKSRQEFKETYQSESYMKKKYDSVIYQIVLLALHHVFALSKNTQYIDTVVVNGKINTVDKATGKSIEPYILSVHVSRSAFEEINLESVDPKVWFKSAKGVSAASLANTAPIAPVLLMSREDKRFIEGYNVADMLDDSINLAAINWQDFENLIREIFEKEFNTNGGEVKITQASRDGGVDAVAFDPDPIRGGKIVIQAKRYTNVVGVSAVRDLYGTVLNEGAIKGILVTTSNYGNDAYSFAQGKPIMLMNGANLLYLLEKHGYRAKIDLKQAKEILKG